jgi:hypothetical protein
MIVRITGLLRSVGLVGIISSGRVRPVGVVRGIIGVVRIVGSRITRSLRVLYTHSTQNRCPTPCRHRECSH